VQQIGLGPVAALPQPFAGVFERPEHVVDVHHHARREPGQHVQEEPDHVRAGLHHMRRVNEEHVPWPEPPVGGRVHILDGPLQHGEPVVIRLLDEPEQALREGFDARDLQSRQFGIGVCLVQGQRGRVAGPHLHHPGRPQVSQHGPVHRGVPRPVHPVAGDITRTGNRLGQPWAQPRGQGQLTCLRQIHAGRTGPAQGAPEVRLGGQRRVEVTGRGIRRPDQHRADRAGGADRAVKQCLRHSALLTGGMPARALAGTGSRS